MTMKVSQLAHENFCSYCKKKVIDDSGGPYKVVSHLIFVEPLPVARPMGISNNRLNNRYITASSIWNRYHAAWLARLYNKKRGRNRGGWSAKVNRRGQWIQFDLRRPKTIVKVVTQGRADANQWVTRYFIKYSSDAFYWTPYRKNSRAQVYMLSTGREVHIGENCAQRFGPRPIIKRNISSNIKHCRKQAVPERVLWMTI